MKKKGIYFIPYILMMTCIMHEMCAEKYYYPVWYVWPEAGEHGLVYMEREYKKYNLVETIEKNVLGSIRIRFVEAICADIIIRGRPFSPDHVMQIVNERVKGQKSTIYVSDSKMDSMPYISWLCGTYVDQYRGFDMGIYPDVIRYNNDNRVFHELLPGPEKTVLYALMNKKNMKIVN